MCLGVQQPFRQWNPNLKRTQCPKAIKTGRRSAGESLWLASADGYTLLLYPSALFPSPVSLCSILCIISFHSHERTHKHLSLPSPHLFSPPACQSECRWRTHEFDIRSNFSRQGRVVWFYVHSGRQWSFCFPHCTVITLLRSPRIEDVYCEFIFKPIIIHFKREEWMDCFWSRSSTAQRSHQSVITV